MTALLTATLAADAAVIILEYAADRAEATAVEAPTASDLATLFSAVATVVAATATTCTAVHGCAVATAPAAVAETAFDMLRASAIALTHEAPINLVTDRENADTLDAAAAIVFPGAFMDDTAADEDAVTVWFVVEPPAGV